MSIRTVLKYCAENRDNRAVPQMILNNQVSLLQNSEIYFPVIEAALDRAIDEIHLEAYIFAYIDNHETTGVSEKTGYDAN